MIPSTAQVLGFFNLLVGFMLVASLLFFIGGFIMYLIRLGTWPTYRDTAIELMEWGVSILFTVIVLLTIQQFLLSHLLVAVSVVSMVIIVGVVWIIAKDVVTAEPAKKPEEH
jgi:hypothetical protein